MIIIAHRYSMVRDADHVIVLDAGEVVEEGSPSVLLEKGGWFADFAAAAEQEQDIEMPETEPLEEASEEEEDWEDPNE